MGYIRICSRCSFAHTQAVGAMGPRRCKGSEHDGIPQPCIFHPTLCRAKGYAKKDGKCVVCSPEQMVHMCSTAQLRGCLVHHLRRIREMDVRVCDEAISQVPLENRMRVALAVCGENWRRVYPIIRLTR
jgi:hypothetical protein